MGTLLDIIGSTFLVVILASTVFNINNNFSQETFKTSITYQVQSQAVQLGRIMEHDFYKIGYRVDSFKVLLAESARIRFVADLENSGVRDTVEYTLGDTVAASDNPRDKQLNRLVNGSSLFISYNVTRFRLMYFDSARSVIATPITTRANRDRIWSVRIVLSLESPDPVDYFVRSETQTDTIYSGAYYEKWIYPRNLPYYR